SSVAEQRMVANVPAAGGMRSELTQLGPDDVPMKAIASWAQQAKEILMPIEVVIRAPGSPLKLYDLLVLTYGAIRATVREHGHGSFDQSAKRSRDRKSHPRS